MKKFEITLILVVLAYVGIVTYGMFKAKLQLGEQKRKEQQTLERENEQFKSALSHHEVVLGKYVDSISDEMLRDFYPQATSLDSLRSYLINRYENQN